MEYKGFKIEREGIGRYGTTYRYVCGKFIAPRKKDITNHIDKLIERKYILDLELSQLKKLATNGVSEQSEMLFCKTCNSVKNHDIWKHQRGSFCKTCNRKSE